MSFDAGKIHFAGEILTDDRHLFGFCRKNLLFHIK
jgi:hypothetical protein